VLNVADWAEIRRLRLAEGTAIAVSAHRLAISRNTVKKALAGGEPPRYPALCLHPQTAQLRLRPITELSGRDVRLSRTA
jgi:hypothetical protein